MIRIDENLSSADLRGTVEHVFDLAGRKIQALDERWNPVTDGAPVFTSGGRYTQRGWTEWTQGFQFGLALLQFEATGESQFLELGRARTVAHMAPHLTHTGVHDHGFNNVSTYGVLLRLMARGKIPADAFEKHFYELAIKVSGAVQASRWTSLPDGLGYVYSFNGPHSLFSDTIRSMRALALSDRFGHALLGEQDARADLFERVLIHAETTARYNVYFGEGRDVYDVRGRVVHESIFNVVDGAYRCPSTQQGYTPFSTWTRGLAWILCGYAELAELIDTMPDERFASRGGKAAVLARFVEVARATADFYIEQTPTCGIPYWDTGAPGLVEIDDLLDRPADPFNAHEPVDSSAAAIAAQGLLRLGRFLEERRYTQAGLTVARSLFADPYLAPEGHEGLILHGVYHRPGGWDHSPDADGVPRGEAVMWGDYHALELALLLLREARGEGWMTFFEM